MSNITCVGRWGHLSVWGHPDATALRHVSQVMQHGDSKKVRPACAIDHKDANTEASTVMVSSTSMFLY